MSLGTRRYLHGRKRLRDFVCFCLSLIFVCLLLLLGVLRVFSPPSVVVCLLCVCVCGGGGGGGCSLFLFVVVLGVNIFFPDQGQFVSDTNPHSFPLSTLHYFPLSCQLQSFSQLNRKPGRRTWLCGGRCVCGG